MGLFDWFGTSSASAPKLPAVLNDPEGRKGLPQSATTDNTGTAPRDDYGPTLAQPGGRRKHRRSRRRGGFTLQNPNLKTGAAPTGAAGTLGGRRRTRKHKGKKHTRRR